MLGQVQRRILTHKPLNNKKIPAELAMQGPNVFHSYAGWRLEVKAWGECSESWRTCHQRQWAPNCGSRGGREGGVEVHRLELGLILQNEATMCGCRGVIGCYVHVVSFRIISHIKYRELKASWPAGSVGMTVQRTCVWPTARVTLARGANRCLVLHSRRPWISELQPCNFNVLLWLEHQNPKA